MAEINIVVALGPSEDSYFLGVGRRAVYNKVPQSLVDKLNGGELPVVRTSWINIDKTGRYWCGENFVGPNVMYEIQAGCTLQSHITQSGAQFITFPDYDDASTDPWFFIKHKNLGHWNASLPHFYINTLNVIREHVTNFDNALKWIIFGKGGTHIYQFENGFLANLEGPHEDPDHALNQALRQFDPEHNTSIVQGQWMVDRGSSISLCDHRYFFLKFKNTHTKLYELRFSLPPHLDTKLKELLALAKTPEEQQALTIETQNVMSQVNAHISTQTSINNMLNNTMMQTGVSFNNATGGAQYELVPKWARRFF
ncbi:hypothetical protein BDQ12DRAFT_739803 [Crucibulum laeve]|uniref:Uncharacterized protein n=1 Tax=Crucibulum laeve TaxID=68775 RepID=A0A5C3LHU5_9AGAR|nr:hypothetical protein BDQ12DRAFT_739803 [Crucibulum laeve]